MDSSSGMKRGGWTWKRWLGIAIGVAVARGGDPPDRRELRQRFGRHLLIGR